jgi:hypothetical protein
MPCLDSTCTNIELLYISTQIGNPTYYYCSTDKKYYENYFSIQQDSNTRYGNWDQGNKQTTSNIKISFDSFGDYIRTETITNNSSVLAGYWLPPPDDYSNFQSNTNNNSTLINVQKPCVEETEIVYGTAQFDSCNCQANGQGSPGSITINREASSDCFPPAFINPCLGSEYAAPYNPDPCSWTSYCPLSSTSTCQYFNQTQSTVPSDPPITFFNSASYEYISPADISNDRNQAIKIKQELYKNNYPKSCSSASICGGGKNDDCWNRYLGSNPLNNTFKIRDFPNGGRMIGIMPALANDPSKIIKSLSLTIYIYGDESTNCSPGEMLLESFSLSLSNVRKLNHSTLNFYSISNPIFIDLQKYLYESEDPNSMINRTVYLTSCVNSIEYF